MNTPAHDLRGEATVVGVYFLVSAAIFFLESSCIIGIDPLGVESTFAFDGDNVVASTGFMIEWPDDETARQVRAMYQAAPDRVIVVECGPEGPIANHPIA